MIESGEHLWRCLVYMDLNMVRAGVVDHPRDWPWSGHAELMGIRKRYRMLDLPRLLRHLGAASPESFRVNHGCAIDEALGRRELNRAPIWTESLAVGSEEFATRVGARIRNRMNVEIEATAMDPSVWIARETPAAYRLFPAPKIDSNGLELPFRPP
jgi:putative transposase